MCYAVVYIYNFFFPLIREISMNVRVYMFRIINHQYDVGIIACSMEHLDTFGYIYQRIETGIIALCSIFHKKKPFLDVYSRNELEAIATMVSMVTSKYREIIFICL